MSQQTKDEPQKMKESLSSSGTRKKSWNVKKSFMVADAECSVESKPVIGKHI